MENTSRMVLLYFKKRVCRKKIIYHGREFFSSGEAPRTVKKRRCRPLRRPASRTATRREHERGRKEYKEKEERLAENMSRREASLVPQGQRDVAPAFAELQDLGMILGTSATDTGKKAPENGDYLQQPIVHGSGVHNNLILLLQIIFSFPALFASTCRGRHFFITQ